MKVNEKLLLKIITKIDTAAAEANAEKDLVTGTIKQLEKHYRDSNVEWSFPIRTLPDLPECEHLLESIVFSGDRIRYVMNDVVGNDDGYNEPIVQEVKNRPLVEMPYEIRKLFLETAEEGIASVR